MYVVRNPATPYVGPISGGVRIGTQIIVEGHVPTWWTHRFDINLVVGHNPTHDHVRHADVALHFNPRFDEGDVVLNSRTGGRWLTEQREHLPIRKGHDFELVVTVEESYFRITVNGQHFANFPHRIAYREVGLVWIDGRVEAKRIEFVQLGGGQPMPVYGQPMPVYGGQPQVYANDMYGQPGFNPNYPPPGGNYGPPPPGQYYPGSRPY